MLGVSGMLGTVSTDGSATAARVAEAQESGGTSGGSGGTGIPVGGFSEEDKARLDEEGGGAGGGGGNRWPRQETMALLKIRSDMDVIFRDSSLKGPLWEQVSRKMAELGYHRNAKKCKEKFENVYKYHKRTKEGRSTKPDGKNYRFFEALEALEHISSSQFPPQPPPPPQPRPQAQVQSPTMATPLQAIHPPPMVAQITVSSTPPPASTPVSVAQNTTPSTTPQSFNTFINSSFPPSQPILQQQQPPLPPPPPLANPIVPPPSLHQTISGSFLSNSMSSSSSTSSDEDIERRHKRKRKWKDYFDKLMKDVVDKQEELQKKFLESLEKRERDRMIREEAWRVQEMARINREHDLLVQERSITAARESALISFLQKMSDQQNPNPTPHPPPPPPSQPQIPVHLSEPPMQRPTPPAPAAPAPAPPQISTPPPVTTTPAPVATPAPISSPTPFSTPPPTLALVPVPPPRSDNGGDTFMGTTSSRWPKAEVEALIKLRTSLDNKYQENGPKGPLWEDISAGMRKIGYNRNAKRCKEKWENINKYFKKVKESNKRRPEDSKTCPYFHQLEALYKEKAKSDPSPYNPNLMAPIMARPEQQWPLPPVQQQQLHHHNSAMDEHEGDNIDDHDDDDDDDDDGDDDEDDEGSGYEIVTNKTSSVATTVG